jgi:hypothetical protein
LLAGCANGGSRQPRPPEDFGVLVMAHGGSPEWNKAVLDAVEPLRAKNRIEVAFGMADAATIQQGVHKLESEGVHKIGVVRLFVSGESWYRRTGQIVGIFPGAPGRPEHAGHASHGEHQNHGMAFWKIHTSSSFALSRPGLAEAPEMGAVLADRAAALSRIPEREDVLVLAHGPGDDMENRRWMAYLDARADAVRAARPFRRVQVETLREDWPEKRAEAEKRVRGFVERAAREGGKAIVIPFRVYGFGPYAKVLEGTDYLSDGRGLIPHLNVTRWIEAQIGVLQSASFQAPAVK